MDRLHPASVPSVAHCFVDAPDSASGVADAATIADGDGHHLARVLRVRVGDVVTIADGRGAWRPGRVRAVDGAVIGWVADGAVRIEPVVPPGIAVAFALGKGDRPERVVRQLTELGVDRIRPVTTVRTVVRWDATKVAAAHARFVRVAREAAMQSRRARLPRVDAPVPLTDLAGEDGLLVGAPDAPGFRQLPPRSDTGPGPRGVGDPAVWTAVVGPEGGFAPGELEALGPYRTVAVGPTVLRTETAPVAIAAVLSARRADDSWQILR